MVVEFEAKKGLRNLVPHQIPGVRFFKGRFRTADKDIISKLLASTEYRRDYFAIKTPIENVNEYLEGSTPDKFNDEILKGISEEGLIQLARIYNLKGHKNYPTVIKTMLRGEYLSDKAVDILDEFKTEATLTDIYEQAVELDVIIRNGPWYKFAPNGQAISKSEADAKIWCEEHKTQLKEAIAKAKQEQQN